MHKRRASVGWWLRELMLFVGASPDSRWRQLQTLRCLDDHLLRDIGVSRGRALGGRASEAERRAALRSDVASNSGN